VLVSAREVRVVFPRDTARAWGWPGGHARVLPPRYAWSVFVHAMDGPRVVHHASAPGTRPDADTAARAFPSLAALVAAGTPGLCRTGMVWSCDPRPVRAAVEGGHVVLTVDDSATIRRLFGLRPEWVTLRASAPGDRAHRGPYSVRVTYVAPRLPPVTDALRAEAARQRRAYEASISRASRSIGRTDGAGWSDTLWVPMGTTAPLAVESLRCTHDVCSGSGASADGATWTTDDTAVLRLRVRREADLTAFSSAGRTRVVAVPVRPGRTTVRVAGLHDDADSLPARRPRARALSRPAVVTPRVGRVEILPRPTSMRRGDSVAFRVRVYTAAGAPLDGAPAELRWDVGTTTRVRDARRPVAVSFDSAGRRLLVGRFLHLADTLSVDVTEPPR
jgi:hypothetical protein